MHPRKRRSAALVQSLVPTGLRTSSVLFPSYTFTPSVTALRRGVVAVRERFQRFVDNNLLKRLACRNGARGRWSRASGSGAGGSGTGGSGSGRSGAGGPRGRRPP